MSDINQAIDQLLESTLSFLKEKRSGSELLVSKENFQALHVPLRRVKRGKPKVSESLPSRLPPKPAAPTYIAPKEPPKTEIAIKPEAPSLEKTPSKEESIPENTPFRLEKLGSPTEEPFSDMRALMHKLYAQMKFFDAMADDSRAYIKPKPKLNLPPVVIFISNETKEELEFLNNLSKAISNELVEASTILLSNLNASQVKDLVEHDGLSLFIGQTPLKDLESPLLAHYKENPSSFTCFLGQVPFIPLRPYNDYFSDPKNKRALWHSLCQILKK